MGDRLCYTCGQLRPHHAKGQCSKCYMRKLRLLDPHYRQIEVSQKLARYRQDPEKERRRKRFEYWADRGVDLEPLGFEGGPAVEDRELFQERSFKRLARWREWPFGSNGQRREPKPIEPAIPEEWLDGKPLPPELQFAPHRESVAAGFFPVAEWEKMKARQFVEALKIEKSRKEKKRAEAA